MHGEVAAKQFVEPRLQTKNAMQIILGGGGGRVVGRGARARAGVKAHDVSHGMEGKGVGFEGGANMLRS